MPGRSFPETPHELPYDYLVLAAGSRHAYHLFVIQVAERRRELVFYDPHTWQEEGDLPTPDCAGIDHGDVERAARKRHLLHLREQAATKRLRCRLSQIRRGGRLRNCP